jgi:hypothetical protein
MDNTPADILALAFSRSTKLTEALVALNTEGLDVVNQAVAGLFQVAARVNPEYFAAEVDADYSPELLGWPVPSAAEMVFDRFVVRESVPVKVVLVPFDDRSVGGTKPAVYFFGGVYKPAGAGAADPTAGEALRLFYSRKPALNTDIDQPLDPQWPRNFAQLLALEVAVYISLKDGLPEFQQFIQARDAWLLRFVAHLEHVNVGTSRRHSFGARFNVPSLAPIGSLVAGGSNALQQG